MSAQKKEIAPLPLSAPDLHDRATDPARPSANDPATDADPVVSRLRVLTGPQPIVAANDLAPPPLAAPPLAVRILGIAAPVLPGALLLGSDPGLGLASVALGSALAASRHVVTLGVGRSSALVVARFGREAEVVGLVHLWSLCTLLVAVTTLGVASALGLHASDPGGLAILAGLLAWPAIAYLEGTRGLWRGRRRIGPFALVSAAPWVAAAALFVAAPPAALHQVVVAFAAGCWLAAAVAFGLELGRGRIRAPRPDTTYAVLVECRRALFPRVSSRPEKT